MNVQPDSDSKIDGKQEWIIICLNNLEESVEHNIYEDFARVTNIHSIYSCPPSKNKVKPI